MEEWIERVIGGVNKEDEEMNSCFFLLKFKNN